MMMEQKPKKEKPDPMNDDRLLVFDMGGNKEQGFGKKPALSSEKKAYSKTGGKPAGAAARKTDMLTPSTASKNPSSAARNPSAG